ncbi:hypothetical protein V1J52_04060 [Streptomyces sp. TRM 70351]|uniref:hypothetical protein n=1 Tax=Streptomyces sp. TRM 70351 TaxID=3116552 RepID=UPI002E7AF043|nr:hypothetical protein [Streptomyces sp. TRM 70351]MEE1927364.1 hypothetical protein [Streptomyces sp. TRM 70351]
MFRSPDRPGRPFSRRALAAAGCAAALALTTAVPATAALIAGRADGSDRTGRADRAASAAPVSPAESAGRYTAEEIHHFLEGFYGNTGPRPWERKNLVADGLKRRAAGTTGYDLLLCAQNTPRDIAVGEVTAAQSAGVGWAPVRLGWGGGQAVSTFTAYVLLDGGQPLRLYDVSCTPPEAG